MFVPLVVRLPQRLQMSLWSKVWLALNCIFFPDLAHILLIFSKMFQFFFQSQQLSSVLVLWNSPMTSRSLRPSTGIDYSISRKWARFFFKFSTRSNLHDFHFNLSLLPILRFVLDEKFQWNASNFEAFRPA